MFYKMCVLCCVWFPVVISMGYTMCTTLIWCRSIHVDVSHVEELLTYTIVRSMRYISMKCRTSVQHTSDSAISVRASASFCFLTCLSSSFSMNDTGVLEDLEFRTLYIVRCTFPCRVCCSNTFACIVGSLFFVSFVLIPLCFICCWYFYLFFVLAILHCTLWSLLSSFVNTSLRHLWNVRKQFTTINNIFCRVHFIIRTRCERSRWPPR